jgi:hypothetical protein
MNGESLISRGLQMFANLRWTGNQKCEGPVTVFQHVPNTQEYVLALECSPNIRCLGGCAHDMSMQTMLRSDVLCFNKYILTFLRDG